MLRGASSRAKDLVSPICPAFEDAVIRLAGVSHLSDNGGDIHNSPVSLFDHRTRYSSCYPKCPSQVRIKHCIPIVIFHSNEKTVSGDSGIIHEDFNAVPFIQNPLDPPLDIRRTRHIHLHPYGPAPEGAKMTRPFVDPRGGMICKGDIRTALGEHLGHRLPDSPQPSCDQSPLAFQPQLCLSITRKEIER